MTDYAVGIRVNGDWSGFVGQTQRGEAAIDKFEKAVDQFSKNADRDLEKVNKKAEKTGGSFQKFAKDAGIALTAIAGGTFAIVKSSINAADEVGKLSQKIGASTEFISAMGYAASQNGADVDIMSRSLVKLADTASRAAGGGKEQALAFEAIGISAVDANGKLKSMDELLPELADKFASMEDGVGKTAIAQRLLGESGVQLIPTLNKGRDGLAEFADEAERYGAVISGEVAAQSALFNDNIARGQTLIKGMATDIAADLLPSLNGLAEMWLKDAEAQSEAARESNVVVLGFKGIVAAGVIVKNTIEVLVSAFAALVDTALEVPRTVTAVFQSAAENYGAYLDALKDLDFKGARDALAKNFTDTTQLVGDAATRIKSNWSVVGDIFDESRNDVADALQGLFAPIDELGKKAEGAARSAGKLPPPIIKTTEALAQEAKAIEEHNKLIDEAEKLYLTLLEAIDPLMAAELEYIAIQEQIAEWRAEGAISAEREEELLRLLGQAYGESKAAIQKETEERKKAHDVVGTTLANLDEEIRLLGMSTEARRVEEAVMQAVAASTEQLSADEIAHLRAGVAERYRTIDALNAQRDASERLAEENIRAAEESRRAWDQFSMDLVRAFESGTDSVKRLFKEMLANLVRQWAAAGLSRMFQSMFGGGGAGGGGFNLGSVASMFMGGGGGQSGGGGFDIMSLLGGGNGSSTGGGGFNTSSTAPWLAAAGGALYGYQNAGSGGISSLAAGAAYGGLAWTGATIASGAMLGAAGATAGAGVGAAAAGAASGAAGAAAAIPIIGWVLAIAALVDMLSGGKLFGTRFRPESVTQALSVSAEGGTASANMVEVRQRSLFRGRTWRDTEIDPGDEAREAAQELWQALTDVTVDGARRLATEAIPVIDASISTIVEYDKKGREKGRKIIVEYQGREWQEETAELAATRMTAEQLIAQVAASVGDVEGRLGAFGNTGIPDHGVGNLGDLTGSRIGDRFEGGGFDAPENLDDRGTVAMVNEAQLIAERWRGSAELLLDGAQLLVAAQGDINRGNALLGETGAGALTAIVDLIEDLAVSGEPLAAAYGRVAATAALLDDAMLMMGVELDRSREEFVRFAVDIADAAGGLDQATGLWNTFFAGFYSEAERAEVAFQRAQEAAQREFDDIDMDLSEFTGEGGKQAFRELFEATLPELSAEAVVQWLEAARALGMMIDLQGQLNILLDETTRAQVRQQVLASARADFGLPDQRSARQQMLDQVELVNDAYLQQLDQLGAGVEDLTALELLRAEAIEEVNRQIDGEINRLLDDLALDLNIDGLSELEIAQSRVNQQFDDYRDQLVVLGATEEQLIRLEELRTEALRQEADALRELRGVSAGLSSNLTRGLGRTLDGILEEATIGVRGDGLTEQQRAIAQFNSRFESYKEQINRAFSDTIDALEPGDAQGRRRALEARNAALEDLEALRLEGLANLNSEWADRILEEQRQRYEEEMRWVRQIRDFIDSLLLDEQVTTLTPEQRLAEARSQFDATFAAAAAGDEHALANITGVARAYLDEARSFFGSSADYTQIFDLVTGSLSGLADQLELAASALLPEDAAQAASEIVVDALTAIAESEQAAAAKNAQDVITQFAVTIDPVVSELKARRSEAREHTDRTVAELAGARADIQSLREGQRHTTEAIQRLEDALVVRMNG